MRKEFARKGNFWILIRCGGNTELKPCSQSGVSGSAEKFPSDLICQPKEGEWVHVRAVKN